MASLTVRKLDEMLKSRLRMRAAANGRSMEEEARVILREALDNIRRGRWAISPSKSSEPGTASSLRPTRRLCRASRPVLKTLTLKQRVIILDTNVISELMRPSPEPRVLRWLGTQPLEEIATTSINLAEIRYGLARLPDGRRRRDLETRFDTSHRAALGPGCSTSTAPPPNSMAIWPRCAKVRGGGSKVLTD